MKLVKIEVLVEKVDVLDGFWVSTMMLWAVCLLIC